MNNHHRIIPAFAVLAGLALLAGAVYVGATYFGQKENSPTTLVANLNTDTVIETNGNVLTNTTVNENTNTSAPEVTYNAPTGPFDLGKTTRVSLAYRKSSDRLISRLAKVDATTGKALAEVQVRADAIPLGLGDSVLAQPPSQVFFGSDGDSIVFLSQDNTRYVGLYRTSLSNPEKIERLVQYDRQHLYNGDIPSISNIEYHAASNQLAFFINGAAGEEDYVLKYMNLKDKTQKAIAGFDLPQEIVGFLSDGKTLQIFRKTDALNEDTPKGKGYLENIRLSDGKVVKSTLIYDEAKLVPAPRNIYSSSDSISPNVKVFVYESYDSSENKSKIYFRNIDTGAITSATVGTHAYLGQPVWSPDSGKIVFQAGPNGVIYDLGKGELARITKFSNSVLWAPAQLLVYRNSENVYRSYDLTTKKEAAFPEDLRDSYGDYYGGSSSIPMWVNR